MIKGFINRNFDGGWTTDLKVGLKNAFAYSKSIDFRKSPSQITVLPQPRREDNGVLKDLVQNEVITNDGTIYATGSTGFFYKRTPAGAWSAESSMVPGTFGMDYRQDADAIYICGRKSVSLYQPVSNNPSMKPAFYASSFSTYNASDDVGFNVNSYQIGSSKTTSITTSYTETNTLLRYFQTDIEPLVKIGVFIVSKGTGDWTLTLHDGLNNVLGTSTITNANLTNNVFNYFTFPDATNQQVRLYVKPNARTYHFHITSTVGNGTVSSTTQNDLSSCDLQIWADRMIQTNNGMHPMTRFLQYECIGNGNYLSVWEPLSDPPTNDEWLRHRLVFPQEYEVCGSATFNEYIAIACERTTTSTDTPQDGIIFFWDGLSPSYNYFTKIPEGSPYALHEYKNIIYYYAGGTWYAIGSPASQPVKIRTMPGTDTEYSGSNPQIKVYPYAATVRKGIHMIGWPSTTTNTNIQFGTYSYGAVDKNFPNSFGYSYPISTGSQTYTSQNNLTIGMVKAYGSLMHVSWRDDLNGGYGIDVVDNTSPVATNATWESIIFDNGFTSKEKTALYLLASFLDLPDKCSFRLKYKINRASDWTYSDYFDTDTLKYPNILRYDISGQGSRFYEFQCGIDITTDGMKTPTFTSIGLIFNDNSQESLS